MIILTIHIIISYDQNISLIFYLNDGSHVRLRHPSCVYISAQRQYTAVVKMCTLLKWLSLPYILGFKEILFRTFQKWSEEISSSTLYWIEISSRTFRWRYHSIHSLEISFCTFRWAYPSIHFVGDIQFCTYILLRYLFVHSVGDILLWIPCEISFCTFRWRYSSVHSVWVILPNISLAFSFCIFR